jgi:hypothetical protein
MQSKKILILVMNSDLYPSKIMIPFIKKTYLNEKNLKLNIGQYEWPSFKNSKTKSIPYLIFQGGVDKKRFENDTLYLNYSKDLSTQPLRFLDTLEWIEKNINFDYIYRTTTTACIDIEKLYSFIEDKPYKNYYSSTEQYHLDKKTNTKLRFGSGSGFFLSKDIVSNIVKNKSSWDFNYLDDVALGKLLLEELGYELSDLNRQDFIKYPLLNEVDSDQFHFRFRLDLHGYPRLIEPLVMVSIYMKINYQARPSTFQRKLIHTFDVIFKFIFLIAKLTYFLPKFRRYVRNIKKLFRKFIKRTD